MLDRHDVLHGNWEGTSISWTTMVWLGHILSEGDQRLNPMEERVEKRVNTPGMSIGAGHTLSRMEQ